MEINSGGGSPEVKSQVKVKFFVSKNGNDTWSGKLPAPDAKKTDGPFATLKRARDAIRKTKAESGLRKPIIVMVRKGKYFLEETLVLDSKDSGSLDCPITYIAYPGEEPILSGGKKITDWKPYKEKILQCDVPGTKGGRWKFRQLFFNGKRQIRARYPNFDPDNPLYGGWAFPEGQGSPRSFKYQPGTFKRHWEKPTEAEVFLLNGMALTDIVPIKSIDEENRIITLIHRVKDHSGMPYVFYPEFHMSISPGYHFYVENVLEELDQPGEWCLDSEEGKVYFWPAEPMEGAEVVAPILDCLIDLSGASYINISGFTFTETRNGGENMHRGGQEGYGAMLPTVERNYCGEALHMIGTEHCSIENNHFYAVGGNAIYAEGYNSRNLIQNNEISCAGAIGICLIGSQYSNPKLSRRYPLYNEVRNNHIHHCGVFEKYVAGVFLGLSQGNVVAHNLIESMPHHAINLGNSAFGRNIIEYNEIRHVCLESSDKGGINCWMEDPYGHVQRDAPRCGHIIRYNLIADIEEWVFDDKGKPVIRKGEHGNPTFGIYLDNYTSNCFVYGNIVVRSGSVGVYVQGGKNNVIENNIIVDSEGATHFGGWWQPQMEGFMTGNHFCRNIFYRSSGISTIHCHLAYTTEPLSDVIGQSDYNLFFNASGKQFTITESSSPMSDLEDSKRTFPLWPKLKVIPLAEWQRMGFDVHSVIADPLFVDPEHDDYRLRADSPALKLGFVPIDTSKIGRKDKEPK